MILLAALAGGGVIYYLVRRNRPPAPVETAYILPESATVSDSPAEVRLGVETLRHGERVEVLQRTRNWARVRIPDGRTGWIELTDILDGAAHAKGQALARELAREPAQAAGHTSGLVNLRAEPARDAPQLAQLGANQAVEIFDRRLVERSPSPGATPPAEPVRDAWYLVRAGSQVGWVLGRLVTLDIPPAIQHYAQTVNLVAWLVLNTVEDNGRAVPQYLAADREGTPDCDFTHVRVFTWWSKRQQYVTAYVEGRLAGYFPIRTFQHDGAPHFRLRLQDRSGRKFQKVYRMYDTIVRPLGTVDGWDSDALPAPRGAVETHRQRRRR